MAEIPVWDLEGISPDVFPDLDKLRSGFTQRHGQAIVIDNGSYMCKAGWANQSTPPIVIRNLATTNKTGRVLVGPEITEKATTKSPFERNIVQHFHCQEHVLDYVFGSLGFED
jgi:actin-related protein 5